ncbi:MAG: hypothetical protein RLY16_3031 [Bacteroidota bacterium]|jgi:GrpB-like predicted nucleotidyltransferase (UPF0157 family)
MLIVKYTAQWVKDFEAIKHTIDSGLEDLNYQIEHVGSTSVPDLDAKPIIDLDIIYSELSSFEKIKYRLEKMGYYHNGNQGIEGREVFKRSGTAIHEILDTIRHHLYVCIVDCPALERHLLTRDFLRKHEWARLEYQQMKYHLAEKANQDQKQYAQLKELNMNTFIDSIIEKEKQSRNIS